MPGRCSDDSLWAQRPLGRVDHEYQARQLWATPLLTLLALLMASWHFCALINITMSVSRTHEITKRKGLSRLIISEVCGHFASSFWCLRWHSLGGHEKEVAHSIAIRREKEQGRLCGGWLTGSLWSQYPLQKPAPVVYIPSTRPCILNGPPTSQSTTRWWISLQLIGHWRRII